MERFPHAERPPRMSEVPESTTDWGVRGSVETCVMVGDRPVLRIEADPDFFDQQQLEWFTRLTERIAAKRRLKVIG
jgi:hypothetical protein